MKNARWREDAAWVLVLVLNLSSNPENKVGSHCSPLSISSACPLVLSLGLMNARGRQRQGGLGGGARAPSLPQQGERSGKSPGVPAGEGQRDGVSFSAPPSSPPRSFAERGGDHTPGRPEGGWE